MPASTRCSAGRSVTLLLLGRASRLEPGGRRLGESGEEALRRLKSALWMAARGEVGDVEDAGSDTLPGNRPRLGPWASSQLVRPGFLTVSPSSKPVTQWGRRGRRRGPGPRRVPCALAKPSCAPEVIGVPHGDSCTRVQCAGVATLPPSRVGRGRTRTPHARTGIPTGDHTHHRRRFSASPVRWAPSWVPVLGAGPGVPTASPAWSSGSQ